MTQSPPPARPPVFPPPRLPPPTRKPSDTAYLFLDEGGNLDFSPNGTKYFTMTSVLVSRPFAVEQAISDLRYQQLEDGHDREDFHAAEDDHATRRAVFGVLSQHLPSFRVDSIIVEKRKTAPTVREDGRFYPMILAYLLRYVFNDWRFARGTWKRVVAVTDILPNKKVRKGMEKGLKIQLARILPGTIPYKIYHHDSKSCWGLQAADYFNWAIYRRWTTGDAWPLDAVQSAVRSQFPIFKSGIKDWY